MPVRPDLPMGLSGGQQPSVSPVRLPRMNFPMVGGVPESMAETTTGTETSALETETAMLRSETPAETRVEGGPQERPSAREEGRILVYGRAGCPACLNAIQDLIDRQVSFIYYDINRDAGAMEHVQAICGGSPLVPVIVQIGFRGDV